MIPNGDDGLATSEGTNSGSNKIFMTEMADVIQSSNPNDVIFFLKDSYKYYGKYFPCITGSDAHSFEDYQRYDLKKTTWIKGEKNFDGLKSILYDPENRVRIQENQPVKSSSTKIISSIEFNNENFTPNTIHFNEDINVIIGGRSSGKSLLLSLLGKKSGSVNPLKNNSSNYEAMIEKYVQDAEVILLDGSKANGEMHLEYFYQDKLQEIARDTKKRNDFINTTLGKNLSIEETKNQIAEKRSQMLKLILNYENLNSEFKKINEINLKMQPIDIIEKNIEEFERKKNEISISLTDSELVQVKSNNEMIDDLTNSISILGRSNEIFDSLLKEPIIEINNFFNEEQIEQIHVIEPNLHESMKTLNDNIRLSIGKKKSGNEEKKKHMLDKLSNISASDLMIKYKILSEQLPQLNELNNKLKIEKEILQDKIKSQDSIEDLNNKIDSVFDEIQSCISWESYIKTIEVMRDQSLLINLQISVDKEVIINNLRDELKTGSKLYKNDIACGELKKVIDYYVEDDIIIEFSLNDFLRTLKNLHYNRNKEVFKAGYSIFSLLKKFAELEFIKVGFEISYEQDNFEKMSEGKKAFVLLLIKLQFGEDSSPLMIDQPEDNLDNRSIVNNVVEYFKKEKIKRQLFIVTHNANIVVATDSENVIIANENDSSIPNPDGVKYYYKNGCLENLNIRKEVCEILEGGKEAFKARENRYKFL